MLLHQCIVNLAKGSSTLKKAQNDLRPDLLSSPEDLNCCVLGSHNRATDKREWEGRSVMGTRARERERVKELIYACMPVTWLEWLLTEIMHFQLKDVEFHCHCC